MRFWMESALFEVIRIDKNSTFWVAVLTFVLTMRINAWTAVDVTSNLDNLMLLNNARSVKVLRERRRQAS